MSSIALFALLSLTAAQDPNVPVLPAPAPVLEEECACDSIGRTESLAILTGGLALGVTSLLAFSTGFEAERQLRSGEARGVDEQNTALTQRAVSAWIAWPTAVLSVAGVLGGGWLVADDEGAL